MRAGVLHAPLVLRVEDRPEPVPEQDGVLIEVAFNGLCGTDATEYGKGPLRVVEAFARLRSRAGGVSLRMAGDGPQRQEANALANASALNGACSFVGAYGGPEERSVFMQSIDVLMLPTLAEGIVADADLVDAGAIFGTGFAPFRGGPLHYAQSARSSVHAEARIEAQPG